MTERDLFCEARLVTSEHYLTDEHAQENSWGGLAGQQQRLAASLDGNCHAGLQAVRFPPYIRHKGRSTIVS